MSLAIIDLVLIALYFMGMLALGVYFGRKSKKTEGEDYILAGRKLTLPLFVASLVATWYGNILGMGEFVYSGGVVAWFCFGLPYYIAAYIFAMLLAKRVRQSNAATIPEQISKHYGEKAGWISSIIVLLVTIPAAYILMLGTMIELFTGWNLALSVLIGSIISIIYIYHGGFIADVVTNTAQFVLMYLGFGVLLVFAISNYGWIPEMIGRLPASHLHPLGSSGWQYVLSWYIIAFQTFIDPSFHQRCAAAKSPAISKNGVLVSIACWVLFDTLTLLTGLYAKAWISIDNPLMAYPALANAILPAFWKGIFIIALLATVMSTLDSYAFLSATTIGNDILKKLFKSTEDKTRRLTQVGLVITSVIGIAMAIAIPSAIDLIYKTSSIAVPALILPLTVSYSKRFELSKRNAIIIMLSSALIALIWTLGKMFLIEKYEIFGMFEPMIPGIVASVVLGVLLIKKVK